MTQTNNYITAEPAAKSLLSSLRFLGISHRECPLEVRSRYALTADTAKGLQSALCRIEGVKGSLILSTCNRTEFYFDGGELKDIRSLLKKHYSLAPETFNGHFRELLGWNVIKHMYRLAAGLDSMILGETQIVGQIKQAVQQSQATGCMSSLLAKVCQGAFKAGKRVRCQTELSTGAASVSYTALGMAREYFERLTGLAALVIGTGDMGRDVVYNLREKGLHQITVMNRTREKGEAFAHKINGRFKPFDQLAHEIPRHDIIITCTSAGQFIISPDMIPAAQDRRQLFLDLSVPANIAKEVEQAPHVRRIDLDTIQAHIDSRMVARENEVPRADAIVSEELLAFQYKQILDIASPAIINLREEFERIRQEELKRLASEGREDLAPQLDILSQRLVKRLAVLPLEIFRQQAESDTLGMDSILDATAYRADD